jgi:regulator of cell morphogenesis and NO signaling
MKSLLLGMEIDQELEKQPFASLMNHIMFEHHLFLRTELPLLSESIRRSMQKYGGRYKELVELHHQFQEMKGALEQHLFEEEDQVFPLITEYARVHSLDSLLQAKLSIKDLELAHGRVRQMLKGIRQTTSNFLFPEEGSQTIKIMYMNLMKLETRLLEHIRVENDILFPRVRKLSSQ